MPETSTGGTGDRADTRSPAVPLGYVRIDVEPDWTVTFTTSVGTVVTDRLVDATYEFDTSNYRTESGYSFIVPRTFRSGDIIPADIIPADDITRNPGQRIDTTTFGDRTTRYITGGPPPQYAVGGYIEPTLFRRNERDGCPCDMCRQRRAETSRPPETADQRARQQEAINRARAERQAKEAAADARAEETLRMVLRPKELAHYDRTGEIIITGADGNRYLIDNGVVSNVHLLAKRGYKKLVSFCCHPKMWENDSEMLPYKDAHIGQILYLRHDLDRFWEKANKYWHDVATRDEYLGHAGTREDRALRRDAW